MQTRWMTFSTLLAATTAIAACGSEGDPTGEVDQSVEACLRRTCGNGRIDRYEECDGSNLKNQTCASATMGARPSGKLKCNRCKLDTRKCTKASSGSGGTGGISGGSGGAGGGGGSGGTAGSAGKGGVGGLASG